jgi:large subunit ribosomal protein L17
MTALFRHGRVKTTEAKAKSIRRHAEKLITVAKKVDPEDPVSRLNARRRIGRLIFDKSVAVKILDEWAPRYADRPGGYTRIYKLGPRLGDNAEMVLLELVE